MKCMNCGDTQMACVNKEQTPGWAIVLAIFLFPLGLIFLFAKRNRSVFVCTKCGYRFEP